MDGATIFFCGAWLNWSRFCLKILCLARVLLFWSFGYIDRLWWGFFCLCLLVFLDRCLFGSKSRIYSTKQKSQGSYYHGFPQVPSWSIIFSLTFRIKKKKKVCMQCLEFLVIFIRSKEIMSIPFAKKWKSPSRSCFKLLPKDPSSVGFNCDHIVENFQLLVGFIACGRNWINVFGGIICLGNS